MVEDQGLAIVAHRGYSAVAPENTLPAFAAALRGGTTFVEFDVRTSADGVPVVIHDRTLERTTSGAGPVWEQPLSSLVALDAGMWFSTAYAGVRVPTLTETLELIRPSCARMLLEIKPPAAADQVKTIVEMIFERGLAARTVVQSFDPDVVRLVRAVAPALPRALLRKGFEEGTVGLAQELEVTYCNPATADVLGGPETMGLLREAGIAVMPWTANDVAEWHPLIKAGVAGLITDRVAELVGWFAS